MRIDPSIDSLMGNIRSGRMLGARNYDEMTEHDWVSVDPVLPPITMEEFEPDYTLALAELGISHKELVKYGSIPVDLTQAHHDIVSSFNYLYGGDDDGFYGDDEDNEDGDDGDGNMCPKMHETMLPAVIPAHSHFSGYGRF